jgi:pimeloyl-ACP methyl ester carboxylesterase
MPLDHDEVAGMREKPRVQAREAEGSSRARATDCRMKPFLTHLAASLGLVLALGGCAASAETGASEDALVTAIQGPKTIQAAGLSFSYLEAGSGPLVLCLHGFPDTAHTFDDLLPRLARAGYHAVAPSMRGYTPGSIPADGDYSELRLGKDVLALIDAFGQKDAFVVGHDWGAVAGYAAASLDPTRLRKLVTVAIPHPRAIKMDLGLIQRNWHFFVLPLPEVDTLLRHDDFAGIDWITHRWSPTWAFTDEDVAPVKDAFADNRVFEAAIGYYGDLLRNTTFGFFSAEARAIRELRQRRTTVPTLTLYGANDGAGYGDAWSRTADAFAGPYEQIELPDVGHFAHREAKERFATEVLRFLSK